MKEFLVFSNFGYQTGVLGGQTIKVQHLYSLLESKAEKYGYNLSYFDTDIFKKKTKVLGGFFSIFKKLVLSNVIFFVGSKNNLKYFFPFIYLFSKVFKSEIHYIVVGGWLNDFLKLHPYHVKCLSSIAGIYPETQGLCDSLIDSYNFRNVHRLDNFRCVDVSLRSNYKNNDSILKLIFIARVTPLKGIDTLFKLADEINERKLGVSIDIYGPIDSCYKHSFFEKLNKFSRAVITYKNTVQPSDVYEVISKYDLLLFPTKYSSEGSPGSVLDAYISGVPVVASNWPYATEFIRDNETGIITDFDDDNHFVCRTLELLNNPDWVLLLKENAQLESKRYSPEAAWRVLKKNVFKRK